MVDIPLPGLPGPGSMLNGLDIASIVQGIPNKCGFNQSPYVIVAVATATPSPLYMPVAGATVERRTDYITTETIGQTDDNGIFIACAAVIGAGITQYRIKKDNVDFGNGVGQFSDYKTIWGAIISTGYMGSNVFQGHITCLKGQVFDLANMACAPIPCIGSLIADTSPLSGISGLTPQSVLNIPLSATVNDQPQSIPVAIYVDGRQVSTQDTSSPLNIIGVINSMGADALTKSHTVRIESTLANCNIPPVSFNVPALVPPAPICTPPAVYDLLIGKCETPPAPPGVCKEGEQQTFTCPDGSEIVIAVCQRDPRTGQTVFIPTGKRCPIPTPPVLPGACKEGEQQTFRCPDGSEIVVAVCQRDPRTGQTVFVPTGKQCPIPTPTPTPPPPIVTGKSVKITTLAQAYPGQEVTIVVTVLCGGKPSNGEWAELYVDGKMIDERPTSNGAVTFTWTATSGTHRIAVDVPSTDFCNREGRDAVDIDVSSQVPPILEQLEKERAAFRQQEAALEEQRRKIRELQLPYAPTVPAAVFGSVQIPVSQAPPGTTVQVGTQVVAAPTTAPVTVQLPPGTHPITVTPPSGKPVILPPVTIPEIPSPIPIPITLPPFCNPPQIYNPSTGKCETLRI